MDGAARAAVGDIVLLLAAPIGHLRKLAITLVWLHATSQQRFRIVATAIALRLVLGEHPSTTAARDARSRANPFAHYQRRSGDLVFRKLPYRAGEPARLRNPFCPPIEAGTARARRRITIRSQSDCPGRLQRCTGGRKQVLACRHRSRFLWKPMVHGADTAGLGNIRDCAKVYPLHYNVSARQLLCFRSSSLAKVKNC